MAKIKPEQAYAKEVFHEFQGLGSGHSKKGNIASDMRNFRILADGSLQKRSGTKCFANIGESIRGFWKGTLNGSTKAFVVTTEYIYRLENDNPILIGALGVTGKPVRFFLYRGYLYLMDGISLRVYIPASDSFQIPIGYAPLYGRNWHPTSGGTVYEPINLLSKHLRLHYLNTTGSTVFRLPFYVDSIDQVRVDGSLTNSYTLSESKNAFTLNASSTGGSVEVAFTVSMDTNLRTELLRTTAFFCDRVNRRDAVVLYGSPAKNLVFCGAQVDDSMLFASKTAYPTTDPLYIKDDTVLTLGSEPINTLYSNHDRILAFHENGAYALSFSEESDTVEAYPLLHGMGSLSVCAELYLDGDPVVINQGGIFVLKSPSGDPDEFTVTKLDGGLSPLLADGFADRVIVCDDPAHRELWFCDPTDGTVWVYQTELGDWVAFDAIDPVCFFHIDGTVGYASGGRLCQFDENLTDDDGEAITAYYKTDFLSLGYPERLKRSLRVSLCADCKGNVIETTLKTERGGNRISSEGTQEDKPDFFDHRVTLGRFRMLQVTIRDMGYTRSRIRRLALFANL